MKKEKTTRKRKKPAKKREGMNIKQMILRSAIRQGFRMMELGIIALGGALLGVRLSIG